MKNNNLQRIYIDSNCFQRPFDNQSNLQIKKETKAFFWIVEKIESKEIEIITSFMHKIESNEIPDSVRRETVEALLEETREEILYSPKLDVMAKFISKANITPKDAFHLASAILAEVDAFITCDRPLIKKAMKLKLAFPILNPIEYKGVY